MQVQLQTLPELSGPADEHEYGVLLGNGARLTWSPSPSGGALAIREVPPVSLRLLDRSYVQPLVSLLQLATGLPAAPMTLAVSEQDSGAPWWPVYAATLRHEATTVPRSALLDPSRLRLSHVGAWLDRVETLGPLPAAAASVLTNSFAIEQQVLTLTTIAEGLHRRLHSDSRRLSDDVASRASEAAVKAVQTGAPEAVDVVRGLLLHLGEPGFRQRLAGLAEAAEVLVPGLTGKTNRWKQLVYSARNDMAHQTAIGWLDEAAIDQYVTVALSMKWLLRALLLREADLSSSLAALLADHQEYGLFLEQAREWQPNVYGG